MTTRIPDLLPQHVVLVPGFGTVTCVSEYEAYV